MSAPTPFATVSMRFHSVKPPRRYWPTLERAALAAYRAFKLGASHVEVQHDGRYLLTLSRTGRDFESPDALAQIEREIRTAMSKP